MICFQDDDPRKRIEEENQQWQIVVVDFIFYDGNIKTCENGGSNGITMEWIIR